MERTIRNRTSRRFILDYACALRHASIFARSKKRVREDQVSLLDFNETNRKMDGAGIECRYAIDIVGTSVEESFCSYFIVFPLDISISFFPLAIPLIVLWNKWEIDLNFKMSRVSLIINNRWEKNLVNFNLSFGRLYIFISKSSSRVLKSLAQKK